MNRLKTHLAGYPRIGARRELKWALEKHWSGNLSEDELEAVAKSLRHRHWAEQHDAGIDMVACNDFSLYDHILDTACTFGIIPERYDWTGGEVSTELYFTMARGTQKYPALALTKWMDTNYHHLIPEHSKKIPFRLDSHRILTEYNEARDLGYQAKPVIIGPVTLLGLCRATDKKEAGSPLARLEELLPLYANLFNELSAAGAEWIQLDEPILSTSLSSEQIQALTRSYEYFKGAKGSLGILLATYFGKCAENINLMLTLPVEGIHVDTVSSPNDGVVLARYKKPGMILSLGVIDGRNIWANNLQTTRSYLEGIRGLCQDETDLWLSSSCSLQYVPYSLVRERALPVEIKSWLSFAREKLCEINTLADVFVDTFDESLIQKSQELADQRQASDGVNVASVRQRVDDGTFDNCHVRTPYSQRRVNQKNELDLPLLPTTTIGSFPQTGNVRAIRAQFKKGGISHARYENLIKKEIKQCIRHQEEAGIDVLVHGEFERNDMVEYFASGLEGFCVTEFGWVQSYGSRCTKPPIIWGDVYRKEPITLNWINYAQSLTSKPVKGMLTGATTILQWSFLRDDRPRRDVSRQIALALRDEILDLERSGVKIIQLDEAALREGLPLDENDRDEYLQTAVESFQVSTSGVHDSTQIHTHMCYSQFTDIFHTIIELDADVISIETTRGRMDLLGYFKEKNYPNDIGPGVWDIHSPRIPSVGEMTELLEEALISIPVDRLWVNPDCGLKTRGWKEVVPAMENLVTAAQIARARFEQLV